MIRNKGSYIAGRTAANLFFLLLSIACLAPIILIIAVSFSDNGEILHNGYTFWPQGFNLEGYKYLLSDPEKVINAYYITLIATVCGTIVSMVCTILLAYVTSREGYKLRNVFSFLIFFTMLFHAGMAPTYIWITQYLNLRDTWFVLILPMAVNAWNIVLMRSFFLSIPGEIIEAATIDGCSEPGILLRMVVPLSKPALATVGLFTILSYFNDWQTSMLYMSDENISIQYFLYKTMSNLEAAQKNVSFMDTSILNIPQEPARMAMAVIAMLPVVIVFPFLQKYFVKGITLGSVKG